MAAADRMWFPERCAKRSEPTWPASDIKHAITKKLRPTQATAPENHFRLAAATENFVWNRLQ